MKSTTSTTSSENFDQVLRENSVSTRLKLILIAETKERGRFSQLEGITGIPAATWRTWWTRGSVPSGALVEAVAKHWPHFAYWLVTGQTDVRCGHDMPNLQGTGAQGYISNWPEETTMREKAIRSDYSREYLKTAMELDEANKVSQVAYTLKSASLRLISEKRHQEISKNFDVKLSYEKDY